MLLVFMADADALIFNSDNDTAVAVCRFNQNGGFPR
jgi:hypothetical protein